MMTTMKRRNCEPKPFNVDDDETNFSFPLNARFIHNPVHCILNPYKQHNKDKLRCDDARKKLVRS